KVGMRAPDDVSEAARLLDARAFSAEHVVAILGKTEGNGGVNDYTRALATLSFQILLAERSGQKVSAIAKRVPIIWSGGTEGLMSPHATIFTREPDRGTPSGQKRLAVGTGYTRDLLPEEFGTAVHAQVAAEGVSAAIKDAGIESPADLHFVQIKTGALTTERVNEARRRSRSVVTSDTYKSMAYGRAAAALGIGVASAAIEAGKLSDDVILHDFSIFSEVASTSSGVELMNCEVIVLGNSARSTSGLHMAHALMKDAIDGAAASPTGEAVTTRPVQYGEVAATALAPSPRIAAGVTSGRRAHAPIPSASVGPPARTSRGRRHGVARVS